MQIRSLAALAIALGLGSIYALLPAASQAGEVLVDPAPVPPRPAPPRAAGVPVGPVGPEAPVEAPRFSREQLLELVGPVALYPDVVLSSLLPASTSPLDVVQAARWLARRTSPDEPPPADAGWDPAVLALLQFPELIQWLDENLEWLEQLGLAMTTQPGDVLAAIQEFRERARASGALATNDFQQVVTREVSPPPGAPAGVGPATIVCIEPVEPQVVYVPVYDPVVVLQPVTIIEPVVVYSSCWTFASYGPCAWHDLTWGWPCSNGWWGGAVYVHPEPWHCGRPRPTHYVSDAYAPSRWHPSHSSRAYAPRTVSDGVVRPRRPVWDGSASRDALRRDGSLASRAYAPEQGSAASATERRTVARRTGGAAWTRRGLDLPEHVTSVPRSSWDTGRRSRTTLGSAPSVTPALPGIPPSMGTIPPALPGTSRRTLGTSRPSPSLGDSGATPDTAPQLPQFGNRYAPRTRGPVVVHPKPPTETVLREPAVETPAPSLVLPPTTTGESRRTGRWTSRRGTETVETPQPPVTTAPRVLPAPSRAPYVAPRQVEPPSAQDVTPPIPSVPRTTGRSTWRSSRGAESTPDTTPRSTETPRFTPDRGSESGRGGWGSRRSGDGVEFVPPTPRRR